MDTTKRPMLSWRSEGPHPRRKRKVGSIPGAGPDYMSCLEAADTEPRNRRTVHGWKDGRPHPNVMLGSAA